MVRPHCAVPSEHGLGDFLDARDEITDLLTCWVWGSGVIAHVPEIRQMLNEPPLRQVDHRRRLECFIKVRNRRVLLCNGHLVVVADGC